MTDLLTALAPEISLAIVACILFLVGTSNAPFSRRLAGHIALVAVAGIFVLQLYRISAPAGWVGTAADHAITDAGGSVHVHHLANYVKLITAGIGVLLVSLNQPSNADATGTAASQTGTDTAEFFGLLLLSLTGLMLVASANDLILLFLGIELASIPTYIMVSISRPLPIAQEAGLKYFFLGAMSAAIMLFGFSYLYGVTGTTSLDAITVQMSATTAGFSPWLLLATLLLIGGFAFKMAAFPLHSYAGDVYTGAATPVTALLGFVPKASGFVALIKILFAVGGGTYAVPPAVVTALAWIAGLTMSLGNLLALRQLNVKRMFAYSSVAQSGYMLVGITALVAAAGRSDAFDVQQAAVAGILFYLATYGLMTVASFGVLQLLPARHPRPATSAETLDDLAGQGRNHVGLGLAMAVACMSLAGVPLTSGFLGKLSLAGPAARADLVALSIVLWVNAAISAAYYLRVIATLFMRAEPVEYDPAVPKAGPMAPQPWALSAVYVAAVLTLVLGVVPQAIKLVQGPAARAADLDMPMAATVSTATPVASVRP